MARPKTKKRQTAKRDKIREKTPVHRFGWPSNWIASAVLILLVALAAIVHVRSKLQVVQLGYRLSEATQEHKRLLADHRKLQVEVATLRSPRRLRQLATQRLDLSEPVPAQIVRSSKSGPRKLAMGEQ